LHDKIDHADHRQLEDIYGLIINYFNGQEDESEWDLLSEPMQREITESLEQAKAGIGRDAQTVISEIRKKYGLNG